MEIEQLAKRIEWLDDERRKDKTTIATLEERIKTLEGSITPFPQQINDMNTEISRVSTTLARLDQFDASLAQIRVDFNRSVEGIEKLRGDHEREVVDEKVPVEMRAKIIGSWTAGEGRVDGGISSRTGRVTK